jgi:hypothetical protein
MPGLPIKQSLLEHVVFLHPCPLGGHATMLEIFRLQKSNMHVLYASIDGGLYLLHEEGILALAQLLIAVGSSF